MHRALLLSALAASLVAAGCVAAPPAPPTPGAPTTPPPLADALAWSARADAPAILAEVAIASDDTTLYAIGGWTQAGGGSPLAFAYDARADAWTQLPPYPLAIHHAQAAVVDGTLYVFGGAVTGALLPGTLTGVGPQGWPITDRAFKLDPGADAWTDIAPLPQARGLGGAAVVEGRIYLVGGVTLGGAYLSDVDVYEPARDAYASAPPLPTTRDHLSVVALDGKVHAIAGRSNANGTWDDVEAHEALDVANGTWARLADAPLGRGGQGAGAMAGGLIALVGGERAEGEFTVYDAAHAYDAAWDAWRELPPLPAPLHGMAAAGIDGALIVAGGARLDGVIQVETLALSANSNRSN